jgi:gamma-glutamyltranspeptidase / glutathione hydrolase
MIHRLSRRSFVLSLMASTALPSLAMAQAEPQQPIISDWPRRQPVFATGGMVSSQEALATRVGVEVLELGGNAIDAAVAVGFALAVTLPQAGNIGGGGFMIVHRADRNETEAIDFRETAPASMKKDVYLNDMGEADLNRSQNSGLGIGIPGTVAGMALALERFGSGKFTLAKLISPAIQMAIDGVSVGDSLAYSLKQAEPRLKRFEATAKIFMTVDGVALPRGAELFQYDLARSLQAIAAQGPKAFYEGPVADKMVTAVNAAGGQWTAADLKNYRAIERDVVKGSYRGHDIVSMPPPSSGGVHLVQILNMLEGFDLKAAGHNSADALHLFAEASKLAYADRSEYLGDPDFVSVPVRGLTSKKYAEKISNRASRSRSKATRPHIIPLWTRRAMLLPAPIRLTSTSVSAWWRRERVS